MAKSDDNMRFEYVYVLHYSKLKRFAKEYVLVEEDAENVVHDVFTDLWERWDTVSLHNNISAFLFLTVKNKCIDFLRRKIISQKAENAIVEEHQLTLRANYYSLDLFDQELLSEKDIEAKITNALNTLPERCREIFIKSKIEGKKHKEISLELDISVKTIEAQISIAYKKLRIELKDYLPLFFFFF